MRRRCRRDWDTDWIDGRLPAGLVSWSTDQRNRFGGAVGETKAALPAGAARLASARHVAGGGSSAVAGEAPQAVAVRRGTGKRKSGQLAAERILKSAHAVLAKGGPSGFSMRTVAAHADLHLANVQYYFPTRDDLIRALLQDIGRRYREAYERCLAEAKPDLVARFNAILEFNLHDIGKRSTRHYFLQLWALLDSLDGGSPRRLSELYAIDLAQLSERIAEIDPAAPDAEVRRRATLLAAMIEGLMLVQGAHSSDASEQKKLKARAHQLGFAIAAGRFEDPRT